MPGMATRNSPLSESIGVLLGAAPLLKAGLYWPGEDRPGLEGAGEPTRDEPNPARSEVNVPIEWAEAGMVRLEVLDVLGRRVLRVEDVRSIGVHTFTLRLDGLPAGTYFLRLHHGTQIKMQPLVLTR